MNSCEAIALDRPGELGLPPAPEVGTRLGSQLHDLQTLTLRQTRRHLPRDPHDPGRVRVGEGGKIEAYSHGERRYILLNPPCSS